MNKTCDNCYWSRNYSTYKITHCAVEKIRPQSNVCNSHEFGCVHCEEIEFLGDNLVYKNEALYEYNGDYYCEVCLLNKVGAKTYEKTYNAYYYDGKYIGNNLQGGDDAIENLCVKHNLDITFIE